MKKHFNKLFNSGGSLSGIILGGIVALAFIVFGAWLGIWVLLAGGAMDVVEVVRGDGDAGKLLWGIVKFAASGLGWLFVWVGFLAGGAIAEK